MSQTSLQTEEACTVKEYKHTHTHTHTHTNNVGFKNSDLNNNFTYIPSQSKRQTRKRQIIWFNPTHSANVKTNVGKNFYETY